MCRGRNFEVDAILCRGLNLRDGRKRIKIVENAKKTSATFRVNPATEYIKRTCRLGVYAFFVRCARRRSVRRRLPPHAPSHCLVITEPVEIKRGISRKSICHYLRIYIYTIVATRGPPPSSSSYVRSRGNPVAEGQLRTEP